MKHFFLASFAALALTAAVVPAAQAHDFHNGSTVAGDSAGTLMQQTAPYSH
jgi:hypothetical protein